MEIGIAPNNYFNTGPHPLVLFTITFDGELEGGVEVLRNLNKSSFFKKNQSLQMTIFFISVHLHGRLHILIFIH